MKRAEHTNFPFHVCSQTTVICREAEKRSVVTKSREGKHDIQKIVESATRNQSEWQGKEAGRRQTNSCRHRKGEPAIITDRAGCIWERRPSVLCGKSDVMREENGESHLVTQRCKRRRHVLKETKNNWGEPVAFQHNKGAVTLKGAGTEIISQDSHGICSSRLSGKREQMRENFGIRRKAESRSDVQQGVGDGHSSEDGKDTKTFSERRAISLNKQLQGHKHRRRML